MNVDDKKLFYKYLDKCTNYFEFGSGGSTYQALIRDNIKVLYSIENHKPYFDELSKKLNHFSLNLDKLNYILIDMKTKPNTTGHPITKLSYNKLKLNYINWFKYSKYLKNLDKNISKTIDFILIDGRFRAASLLNSFEVINDTTFIAFDDFYGKSPPRAKYYHVVLDYYDIVERGDILVILKKKNVNPPTDAIISKYEKIWL